MNVAIIIVILILLVCLAIGGYTFFAACKRKKEYSWHDSGAIQNTSYAPYINLITQSTQWLDSHLAKEVFITSNDGLKLCALWIPAENARGTILLAHGYRSTMLVDFGGVMDFYHNLGLNLLIPYQRSHGKSEGKYITFGVLESKDMLRWVDFHNSSLACCPMILSGLSMGASTVMYMLDQTLPANVVAAIVDCGFTSPAEIIGKVFHDVTHVRGSFFVRIADIYARIFAKFSLYEKDSRMTLKYNSLPILMVHGKADDFVPSYMSEQAFACAGGKKHLLLAEDAGHGLSFLRSREEYISLIHEILDTTLAEQEKISCYQLK